MPGAPCEEVEVHDERSYDPGDVPEGTVIEVDARSDSGKLTTDRSPRWRGRVTATAPPSVTGEPRVGAIVWPQPAKWAGGWPGDRSTIRLEACRDRRGRRCEVISDRSYFPTCAEQGAVIAPRYRGWWIRAMDHRYGPGTVSTLEGYSSPQALSLMRRSRVTVRSELVGPVRRRSGLFAECGRPRLRVFESATRFGGTLHLARVECVTGCSILLVVRDERRTIRSRPFPGGFTIGIPARTRLEGETVRVRVVVNGRHERRGTVRLP